MARRYNKIWWVHESLQDRTRLTNWSNYSRPTVRGHISVAAEIGTAIRDGR
jgi:hypothetical protein